MASSSLPSALFRIRTSPARAPPLLAASASRPESSASAAPESTSPERPRNWRRAGFESAILKNDDIKGSIKKKGSGDVKIRLDARGYPAYSENGNMLFDALFAPIEDPAKMEVELKSIPGVLEVGIFVIRPITVYKIRPDGEYEALRSGR